MVHFQCMAVVAILATSLTTAYAAPVGVDLEDSLESDNTSFNAAAGKRAECKPVCIKSPNPKECIMDCKSLNGLHSLTGWLDKCNYFATHCDLFTLSTQEGRKQCECECRQHMGEIIQCPIPAATKPQPPKPAPPKPTPTKTVTDSATWTEKITWTESVATATAMTAATPTSVPSLDHPERDGDVEGTPKLDERDSADLSADVDRNHPEQLLNDELAVGDPCLIPESKLCERSKILNRRAAPPTSPIAPRESGTKWNPNMGFMMACRNYCANGLKKWYPQPEGKEDCDIPVVDRPKHCAQLDCQRDCYPDIVLWWRKICRLEYPGLTQKECNGKIMYYPDPPPQPTEIDSYASSPAPPTNSAYEDISAGNEAINKRDMPRSTTESQNHDVSLASTCLIEPELCKNNAQLTNEDKRRIAAVITSDKYVSVKSAYLTPESRFYKEWKTLHKRDILPAPPFPPGSSPDSNGECPIAACHFFPDLECCPPNHGLPDPMFPHAKRDPVREILPIEDLKGLVDKRIKQLDDVEMALDDHQPESPLRYKRLSASLFLDMEMLLGARWEKVEDTRRAEALRKKLDEKIHRVSKKAAAEERRTAPEVVG